MAKLVRVDKPGGGKALGRSGGKLITDADGAPCCCGGQGWCAQSGSDCWPLQLFGERFQVTLEVTNLDINCIVFIGNVTNTLDSDRAIMLSQGSTTVTVQTVRTGSTGHLVLASVDQDTPLQVSARKRNQYDIPQAGVHLAPTLLHQLGFNRADLETVWPLQPGIRSVGDTPLDFLGQGVVNRMTPEFELLRSKEIGLGVPYFRMFIEGSTRTTPCDGATNYQADWGLNVGTLTPPLNGWQRPNPGGTPFPGTTHTVSTSGDGLTTVMTHRALGSVLSGTVTYSADSVFTARWIITPLTPCSFTRNPDLPPGINPETMMPYTQPGRCAGCGQ